MNPLDESLWPGKVLDHWRLLAFWIEETIASKPPGTTILYRGQSQAWSLRPTLLRALSKPATPDLAIGAEIAALAHFQSQAYLHDPTARLRWDGAPPTILDWWAWMQHHQAPTRLLDWTASPYVGAYFAADRDFDQDGVVLVIDADAADAFFAQQHPGAEIPGPWLQDPGMPSGVFTYTTSTKTSRLVTQQGFFTVSAAVLEEHDVALRDAGAIIGCWVVPARTKLMLLQHLRTMNVTASSLFPGLDGLGRATAEIIRATT